MLKLLPSHELLSSQVQMLDTPQKRAKGMLVYERAPVDVAFLFALPFGGIFPLVHCIGMKFSIDILFLNKHKQVKAKFHDIKPGRLVMPWRYVLGGCPWMIEASAGSLAKVQVDDFLDWQVSHAA